MYQDNTSYQQNSKFHSFVNTIIEYGFLISRAKSGRRWMMMTVVICHPTRHDDLLESSIMLHGCRFRQPSYDGFIWKKGSEFELQFRSERDQFDIESDGKWDLPDIVRYGIGVTIRVILILIFWIELAKGTNAHEAPRIIKIPEYSLQVRLPDRFDCYAWEEIASCSVNKTVLLK